jgi:hypothetical protein
MLLARLCQCGRLAQQRLRPAASFSAAPQAVLRKSHTQQQHHSGVQAGASASHRSLSSTREHTDESGFEAEFENRKLSFDRTVFARGMRSAAKTWEDLNDEDEGGFITEDDYSDDEGAAGQVCD